MTQELESDPVREKHPPTVTVEMIFVEHGYQADVFFDGQNVASFCRSFGGDHEIDDLKIDFFNRFEKFLDEFRADK